MHPDSFRRHSLPRAFSKIEILVVISIAAGLVAILIPALDAARHSSGQMPNSSKTRGIHQSMVIFAQDNNSYLPGLDKSGQILPPRDPLLTPIPPPVQDSARTLSGASMAARYFILLKGQYLTGDLLINTQDTLSHWSSPTKMPTPDQFSFALLRIGESSTSTDIGTHTARAAEWRDNASSQTILIVDRNTGLAPTTDQVHSVWSKAPKNQPDWKGTVLWGDNHAEFLNATHARLGTLSLNTKYADIINSDDFLFSADPASSSGGGKSATASAMFGYTSQNF